MNTELLLRYHLKSSSIFCYIEIFRQILIFDLFQFNHFQQI